MRSISNLTLVIKGAILFVIFIHCEFWPAAAASKIFNSSVKTAALTKEEIQELKTYLQDLNVTQTKDPGPPPLSPQIQAFLSPGSNSSERTIAQITNDVIPAYIKMQRKCSDITFLVRLLMDRVRTGASLQELEIFFTTTCVAGSRPLAICTGLAERLAPPFYFIVKEQSDLTPEIFVSSVFQHVGCRTNEMYTEWQVHDPMSNNPNVTVNLSKKPKKENPILSLMPFLNGKRLPAPKSPLKILHMTDIHVDPMYREGSNADCENKIMCCHSDDGEPANSSVTAGRYGNGLSCDTPLRTLESALKNIKEVHSDIDLFYMSGDLVPHNLWYTNRVDNLDTIRMVSDTIRSDFPNTTIVPILGNHEPHPVNTFSPINIQNNLSTRWIFEGTYQNWLDWIPRESAEEYQRTGHYSLRISEGFRILVLNTNLCFGFNFWQLYSFNDFKEQLTWLQSELDKSFRANEAVHIVGHVPPGYLGCTKVFSRNYYDIVTNYSSTVRGQFFGHLHVDTFRIYFNPRNKMEPSSVQWISPSLTPYHINNPAYKIYYADPSTLEIVDHETYIFDLHKANADANSSANANDNNNDGPTWFKLYRATSAYSIPDVRLHSLTTLVDNLARDEIMFEQFFQYFNKGIDSSQSKTCEVYCRKRMLCRLVRPFFGSDDECNDVQTKVDGSVVPIYDSYSTF